MDTIERPYACLCLWETIHKLSVTPDQRRPVHWTRKLSNTARIVVPHDSLRSEFLHSRQLINCTGEKKNKRLIFFPLIFAELEFFRIFLVLLICFIFYFTIMFISITSLILTPSLHACFPHYYYYLFFCILW